MINTRSRPLSHYEILEINQAANLNDINRAFRFLDMVWGPGQTKEWASPDEQAVCANIRARIQEAYKALMDSKTRQTYDLSLEDLHSLPDDTRLRHDWVGLTRKYLQYFKNLTTESNDTGLMGNQHWELLPEELQEMIFGQLSIKDLSRAAVAAKILNVVTIKMRWKKILATEDIWLIHKFLHHSVNFFPETLALPITIKSILPPYKDTLTLFDAIANSSAWNWIETIDKLVARGSKLPQMRKTAWDFESTTDYFKYLLVINRDLYLAVREDPTLVIKHDENKQTLLHLIAINAGRLPLYFLDDLHLICKPPNSVQFISNLPNIIRICNKGDTNGDTFFHLAVKHCFDSFDSHTVFNQMFGNLAYLACLTGFNFQSLNNQGLSVLHLAAQQPVKSREQQVYSALATIFKKVDLSRYSSSKVRVDQAHEINVDILSSEGATPLYYASLAYKKNPISNSPYYQYDLSELENINFLLAHGANPFAGDTGKKPLQLLEEYIFELCETAKNAINASIHQLKLFKIATPFSQKVLPLIQHINYLNAYRTQMLNMNMGKPFVKPPLILAEDWLSTKIIKLIIQRYEKASSGSPLKSKSSKALIKKLEEALTTNNFREIEREVSRFLNSTTKFNKRLYQIIIGVLTEEFNALGERRYVPEPVGIKLTKKE